MKRLFLLILLIIPITVFADLPETVSVAGKNLILNGTGWRKATIFSVKVYKAGLYLEAKQSDPEVILNSTGPKQIRMQFVRSVEADKLINGWNEGFNKNADNFTALSERLNSFNAKMVDVEENDEIVLSFSDKVSVEIKGAAKGIIEGQDFAKALLSVWLGPKPPNKSLKTDLLGSEN